MLIGTKKRIILLAKSGYKKVIGIKTIPIRPDENHNLYSLYFLKNF